jgi:hypothetical protein
VFSISMGLHVVDPSGHFAAAGLSEGRRSANKIELFLFKPVEIIFGQAAVTKQVGENEWKSGVPVVVPSVDLPPTLGQPVFQIPQIRRFLDPCGSAFSFPDEGFQLFAKRLVEGSSGDCLFGMRPL